RAHRKLDQGYYRAASGQRGKETYPAHDNAPVSAMFRNRFPSTAVAGLSHRQLRTPGSGLASKRAVAAAISFMRRARLSRLPKRTAISIHSAARKKKAPPCGGAREVLRACGVRPE